MSNVTLTQVPETEAPPHIAAIYADIRAVSGLPVVNLIWRHFASLPGVLPWAWAAVSPLVGSAAMDAARGRLAAAIVLPAIGVPGPAAWTRAGLTAADLSAINALNEAYIRGNLTNILALTGLRLRLEQPDRIAAPLASGTALPHVPPPIPKLPRIGDLDETLAARVRVLAALHGADGVIPSLYLAFAAWPGLLEALPIWLAPLYQPQTLRAVRASTGRLAEAEASPPPLGPLPEGADAMQPALQLFTRVVIPDLIAVGLSLRRALTSVRPAGPA